MTEPTTQAGHINDAMRARMRIHQAWFAAYPNQPMPEGRDEVERLIAAIEAEARDATTLREALDALSELDSLINMVGSGEYITSNRKRLHLSNLNQRAVDAVRAALAAAPPVPRWPTICTCGWSGPAMKLQEHRVEAFAAVREGGKRP